MSSGSTSLAMRIDALRPLSGSMLNATHASPSEPSRCRVAGPRTTTMTSSAAARACSSTYASNVVLPQGSSALAVPIRSEAPAARISAPRRATPTGDPFGERIDTPVADCNNVVALTVGRRNGVECSTMSGSHRWCQRVLGVALAMVCLMVPVELAFAQDADATVTMQNTLSFAPLTVHIAPGQTVMWINPTSLAHTVTADDGSFD